MKQSHFLFLVVFLAVITSCVSKKKYLEMESGRLRAEQEVRDLTIANNDKSERIEALISEYESTKNELLGNNATKDYYIDSLNNEVYSLTTNIEQASESLEESNYAFEFEKRRLNNLLTDREQKIEDLQQELEDMEEELSEKNSQLGQRNFELNQVRNELQLREGTITSRETDIEELEQQIADLQSEIASLNATMEEKDAEITRLTNNVKLLKDELGD